MRLSFGGQGPPIGSLPPSGALGYGAPGRVMPGQPAVGPNEKLTTVFVGSISAGVSNEFLTSLFAVRLFLTLFKLAITSHNAALICIICDRHAGQSVHSRGILLQMESSKGLDLLNSKSLML